jgi:enamine deaminase RidA (YjgF/YER057c/UK114 family)
MLNISKINGHARCSGFSTPNGSEEIYLTLDSKSHLGFALALEDLLNQYDNSLAAYNLSEHTQVFSRIYLSDMQNQKLELQGSELYHRLSNGAVSIIEQPPLNGGPVSILCYHIKDRINGFERMLLNHDSHHWRNGIVLKGKNYNMLWNANYEGRPPNGKLDSARQTSDVFRNISSVVRKNRMNLLENTLRTWIYVRDIDNHYKGMVDSRRDFFEKNNLTPDTRYLASTGIEGRTRTVNSLVAVDALSISNLEKEQIVRMEALENLSPTIDYGVTFERGLRVRFGDRSHLHVSGTASINSRGEVLYPGNVRKQTLRTLENIKALLKPHGAGLRDMAYMIVYVRDTHSRDQVLEILNKNINTRVPFIFVKGSVCRPAWLVEMEGVGIIPDSADYPVFI